MDYRALWLVSSKSHCNLVGSFGDPVYYVPVGERGQNCQYTGYPCFKFDKYLPSASPESKPLVTNSDFRLVDPPRDELRIFALDFRHEINLH